MEEKNYLVCKSCMLMYSDRECRLYKAEMQGNMRCACCNKMVHIDDIPVIDAEGFKQMVDIRSLR